MDELADGYAFFHPGMNPADMDVYAPRPHQLVPKGGGWAMVTRQLPPVEGGLDAHLRVGRVFYLEHMSDADAEGFQPGGRYKVQCHSPWGTVCLWPYEYTVLEPAKLIALWQEGALLFHQTNVEQARFSEVVFYARSRGIDLADAAVMALGTIQASVGWFEPPSDVAPGLEAMASRINQWPWSTKKRAAARKRKEA